MAKPNKTTMITGHVVEPGEKLRETWVHHRFMVSSVGQYAMELFRNELASMEPMNASGIAQYQHYQPMQRTTVDASVKRACDGAEKLFEELTKRGWTWEMPSLDSMIERSDFTGFGMGTRHGKD